MSEPADLEHGKNVVDPRFRVGQRPQSVANVSPHVEVGEKRRLLRHVTDVAFLRRSANTSVRIEERSVVDGDPSDGAFTKSGHHFEERRFSRSGRSQYCG